MDPLPLIQPHVYHLRFAGSFSIKQVLTLLVPDLTYDDLAIVDGQMASIQIARLLFIAHRVRDGDPLRRDFLAYCERDTWAMVRLLNRLRELADSATVQKRSTGLLPSWQNVGGDETEISPITSQRYGVLDGCGKWGESSNFLRRAL